MVERSAANFPKLHLGCGETYIEGYINIDSRSDTRVDIVADMNNLPFEAESVDEIYACHSIEHIPMNNIMMTIKKLHKILSIGGKIYISVPDFEVLASIYLAGKCELITIVRAIHGGQEYEGNTHYCSFDEKLLTSILTESGFKNIKRYEPVQYLPAGFEDTSTYRICGKEISLNICAEKI